MSTVPAGFDGDSDAELIASVRAGTLAAYGTLYERHVGAAYNLAHQLARSKANCDDLVSEAFAKVLDTLRAGKGPDSAFRAYLLTTLRHTAYDKTRKDSRVDLNDDMTTVSDVTGPAAEALTVQFSDTAVAGLERTMAAQAFARLPERWRAVLWHTEIEQQSPAEVAPLLGLTANGVSALAYRAREGLRQAYLQVHLAQTSAERCRATAERLGAWTRDGLSKRERAQVETHLDECDQCRALAAELADVNGALRAVVAPIVLGGAVFGYLAATSAKASAVTAGAAVAAVAAGAAGGSSAAGAAAAGPRQFVGVAVSGIAIAAAVAIALATGRPQEIPTAAQPPATTQVVPAPGQPRPGTPTPGPAPTPAPVPPSPSPSGVEPASQPVTPTTPQTPTSTPAPAPPTPPAGAPAPGSAKMTAQGPSSGITLQSGGSAVALPITVRNVGETASQPVTATLNLPAGIRAVGVDGTARADSFGVDCPGGQGTVTCTTATGLQPGETAVLTFRLVAGPGAASGEVTGTVGAGGDSNRVPVSIPVFVQDAPDVVNLDVEAGSNLPLPLLGSAWLRVDVRNDGPNAKPVTVTVDQRARLVLGDSQTTCAPGAGRTSCTSTSTLAPKDHLRLWFELDPQIGGVPVTATATLGSATTSKTVSFPWLSVTIRIPFLTTPS